MQLFFLNRLTDHEAQLAADEARHCVKVLRYREGDSLHGIDGQGNKYLTTITAIQKHTVTLSIQEVLADWGEHPYQVELAISPLRHRDRLEWAIEKAVELGVTSIHPVLCSRTVKTGLKASRLESLILSALKQSKRARLPILHPLVPLVDYLASTQAKQRFIPYCEASLLLQTAIPSTNPHTAILIGPEGDFTPEEVARAKGSNFVPVSLGENRLRTETAAIYALSSLKWQRDVKLAGD